LLRTGGRSTVADCIRRLSPRDCRNSPATGWIRMRNARRFARNQRISYVWIMKTDDLITVDPEILGRTPVFKGTRVPVKTLFDYIEDNSPPDQFRFCFPSLPRDMDCRVLERSESASLS